MRRPSPVHSSLHQPLPPASEDGAPVHKKAERRVYAIMGLPFDSVTLHEAAQAVRSAIKKRHRLFISTPNLNFVTTARRNAVLRRTVLNSDLSLADGMPVVWVARLLGIPLYERVSGASLFEALATGNQPPIRVFFFGGPDGVAARACEKLNERGLGMKGVGAISPGFADLDGMCKDAYIDEINRANADFLVVALGAAKGQAWIERNLSRLNTPVISHLGAVVNFAAGTLRRAPEWMQWAGVEWLWRIREEPTLLRRYVSDGAKFLALLVTEVLPLKVMQMSAPRSLSGAMSGAKHGQETPTNVSWQPESSSLTVDIQDSTQGSAPHQEVILPTSRPPTFEELGNLLLSIGRAQAMGCDLRIILPEDRWNRRWCRYVGIPEMRF